MSKAFINSIRMEDVLTGLSTFVIKYVLSPAILRDSSLFSPKAGSTSNSPFKKLKVFSDIWTRLSRIKDALREY